MAELTAGRELDALVAEKVMGLTIAHDMTVGDLYRYHPDGDRLLLRRVPDYSTDIAAAWQVVEKMKGWVKATATKLKPTSPEIKVMELSDGRTEVWIHRPFDPAIAVADTPSLAICLAALKAVTA